MESKNAGSFHRPVVVQPGRIDRDRVVVSAVDAIRVLSHQWPVDCDLRQQALVACRAVIGGEKPPRHARNALIKAARAARILLD
jgi:hypothetical protein